MKSLLQNEFKIHPTALITGAANRIGRQIAIDLHREKINIVIHCNHSLEQAQELCDELNSQRSNSATVIQENLNQVNAAKALTQKVNQHFGRLDYLVNNASIFYPTPFQSSSIDEFDAFSQINTQCPIDLIKAFARSLTCKTASVVNIIDIYAQRGLADHSYYIASKNMLLQATKELAVALAPKFRINSVCPGAILWPENDSMTEEKKQRIIENTALKKLGSVQDISHTVCYLLTQANYMTGANINVDGGRNLYL